ncbi:MULTISPECIES: lamin tail domain-containing protein [unclassified Dietzia]|uniref:lamin tail domain-containing protein n=1 Tax=unclassified Dietzia TaxID=2617939 RepID=UPI0015F8F0DC|nr:MULTISPECIES: lamin tail domain-containing protein [unclassified Dietzia]MBB1024457.1 lamin tail domain-containing protein [Dietzia sp. DQ12-76]MBB1026362.1 lamin tail domain-containing protein [Dietzia sp. DQ11-38-2]
MRSRTISSGVFTVALAAGAALAIPAAAPAAPATSVVINEVESNGDAVGDWVELANLDTEQDVDISGWTLIDDDPTHDPIVIPEGTTIESGGYWSVHTDVDPDYFGLGGNDSVILRDAGGEIVDSTTWSGHSPTTWGRIPDMTGGFAVTGEPTRNARNVAAVEDQPVITSPWPFDPLTITPVALGGAFAEDDDMSGVDIAADGTAYVVNNGTGTLYVVAYDPVAGTYSLSRTFVLEYPDGSGRPDAEGVTVGPDGVIYVATERDNESGSTSRPSILRFVLPAGRDSGTLSATDEYSLTSLTGLIGANAGLEAIEYLPEAFGGAFAVGVEGTGKIHFVRLGAEGAVTEMQTYPSPFTGVMALDHDEVSGVLRVLCDEVCEGRSVEMTYDGTGFVTDGTLYARPAGMPNLANEGFASHRETVECHLGGATGTAERVRFLWADDAGTAGFGLRTAVSDAGECTVEDDADPGSGSASGSVSGAGLGAGSLAGLLPFMPADALI